MKGHDDRRDPWRREAADVAAELGSDVVRGLSAPEAADRLARHGPNQLESAAVAPAWRKLLAQFAGPLIYLLIGAIVVALVAWVLEGREKVPFDAIVIAAIVLLNAASATYRRPAPSRQWRRCRK